VGIETVNPLYTYHEMFREKHNRELAHYRKLVRRRLTERARAYVSAVLVNLETRKRLATYRN
jgi:hypothetical protein